MDLENNGFEELMEGDLYSEFSSFPAYLLWQKFLEREKKEEEAKNSERRKK